MFHLALEATRGAERRGAARILFVVDRRLIVDDAFGRAETIANKLSIAKEGVLKRIADRLRHLAEDDVTPLAVVRLRGGMPKEPDWVRTPAQPTVVVSTVDQVGSRLLFRGYGVSDTMKPIHAGLLGCDALLLLDEAHLSQPLVQTVRDSMIFRMEPWSDNCATAPFGIVTLSATQTIDRPSSGGEEPFTISDEDQSDLCLGGRLGVSKRAELIEVKSGEEALVNRFADEAWKIANRVGGANVVAVVVNRVRRARAIFNALQKKGAFPFKPESSADAASAPEAALLIGRVRDPDRDHLLDRLIPLVKAGADRKRANPLIVVATQCIEAGADFDFDALVTEIAPLDCLRQRFGRLNRMGRGIDARAAIIAASDHVKKGAESDPIYGEALRRTWNLLIEKSEDQAKKGASRIIDLGIERSKTWIPHGEALGKCLAPRKDAPVLLPGAVELWSRTSPIPAADPEVSLYLHGPDSGAGDVNIVWRADIDDGESGGVWIELVSVCPPSTPEAISVPVAEAKRWLRAEASGDIGDTETAGPERPQQSATREAKALRWRGSDDDQTRLIGTNEIRPGDVIVVPALRGGCDRWGWYPESKDPVPDLGRAANVRQRGRDILRLSIASRPELTEEEISSTSAMIDRSDHDIREEFAKHFNDLDEAASRRLQIVRSKDGRPLAIERKLAAAKLRRGHDRRAML